MATILEFHASVAKRSSRPRQRIERPAEIVIFPGVRYDRRQEPKAGQKSKAAPLKIIRDVLHLVE